ncbi:MAG: HD domain-containing phosphohydrolase [Paraglaciecola sp.]|uniref:HD domain-containing phosphohydrolase n=1 Tax=Paraglaciecola sp. TaxID=1920173 RepID=UPI003299470F
MKLANVLMVDDELNILNSYRRTLRNEFNFDLALSAQEALEHLSSNKKYAVIVTDMQMPEMNGLELLKKTMEVAPDTIRIMLTGNSDQETAVNAVNQGDVFRFITKPCDKETLIATIQAGVTQHNLLVAERVLLNRTLKGVINVLSEVLALVNPDAMDNGTKMMEHMKSLAKVLKVPNSWIFEPMVQLSQLGCVIFPQETIKNIDSGVAISEEEKQLFAQHPCLASDLLRRIPRMEKVAENILYQEKCFNGEGIPMDDIKGTQIPLGARMLKVVIDFIRFEKQEQSTEKAYSLLEQQRQYYDPKILAAFKESLNIVVEVPTVIIELSKLKENMIINTNLLTTRNQLVARKGQKVTETLLHIIKHCLENKAIKGKVEVQIIENEE